jgi:ubiquinone/menaquinone biosynthesis C-methylase UbiE
MAPGSLETGMAVSDLFDEWTTYEKVVSNDYMHHRDFLAALESEVEVRSVASPAIVDLGCGDCTAIISLLSRLDAKTYIGIDQSENALLRANANLGGTSVPFTLHCGTMLEELRGLEGSFDLAIACYSLHHLQLSEKQAVLNDCRRLLEPGGLLAIVDVFREEGEARRDYLQRWEANARRTFTVLEPEEMDELLDHVRECDFPEPVAVYRKLGKEAGFDLVEPIARDTERLNRLIVLS